MTGRYGLGIRGAIASDAPGLSELLALAGHPIPSAVMAQRLEAVRGQEGAVLIAVEWGPPSGVVVAHWYWTLGAEGPVARISLLLVSPDRRRAGIGRLLIKSASQAARMAGCGAIEMPVRAGQADLAAFCRESGFDQDGGTRFVRALRKRG